MEMATRDTQKNRQNMDTHYTQLIQMAMWMIHKIDKDTKCVVVVAVKSFNHFFINFVYIECIHWVWSACIWFTSDYLFPLSILTICQFGANPRICIWLSRFLRYSRHMPLWIWFKCVRFIEVTSHHFCTFISHIWAK